MNGDKRISAMKFPNLLDATHTVINTVTEIDVCSVEVPPSPGLVLVRLEGEAWNRMSRWPHRVRIRGGVRGGGEWTSTRWVWNWRRPRWTIRLYADGALVHTASSLAPRGYTRDFWTGFVVLPNHGRSRLDVKVRLSHASPDLGWELHHVSIGRIDG